MVAVVSPTLVTGRTEPRRTPPRPGRALESGRHRLERGTVRLLAPVGDPEKVICVGLNYRDHCLEQDVKVPKEPIIFSKFPSAIVGPFDDIMHPEDSSVRTPPSPLSPPTPGVNHPPNLQPPIFFPPRRWTGRWSWPPSSGRRGGTSR